MKELAQRAYRLFAYGGVSEDEFKSIQSVMRTTNANTFFVVACLCAIIMAGLFIASFSLSSVTHNQALYVITFVICLVLAVCELLVLRGRLHGSILPYIILAIGFAYGIVLGVSGDDGLPAVTFMVLLMGLPMLIIDRPYKVCVLVLAATVGMIICAALFKSGDARQLDIVNAACFCLLSMVANVILTRSQIIEIQHRVQAERGRETDSLTGLGNACAYHNAIAKLEAEVEEGVVDAYGVVVADVNDLKGTNDTYGHAAGDELIRASGRLLCKAFSHSPVMRIGGDEFVALLRGQDYDNRYAILANMRNSTELVQLTPEGEMREVSVAAGIGEYDAAREMHFADVFHDADAAMYQSKAEMKAAAHLGPVR